MRIVAIPSFVSSLNHLPRLSTAFPLGFLKFHHPLILSPLTKHAYSSRIIFIQKPHHPHHNLHDQKQERPFFRVLWNSKMIQLLFTLLTAEASVVVLLLMKTPLRRLVVLALDQLKRGHGPVIVRTIVAIIFIVLVSGVYSMIKIQERATEVGSLTPTDQVLWSRHLLEMSLLGYSLFLALIIDRMHHLIKKLHGLKKNMVTVMKRNKVLEEGKHEISKKIES